MIHASLFSGIGGPEVAAAMLGWENAFHCEINPFGRAVLEYWFPNSESYEDVTKTDFSKWRGKIDVLTAGIPCQPFSYAGKRGGADDERYLWPEAIRVINEIRPTWVIIENVAGIATMVEGGILTDLGCDSSLFDEDNTLHRYEHRGTFTVERICHEFEDSGYSVQPVLIPAAAVGAPHRRDRVFIVAHDADADGGDAVRGPGIVPRPRGTERIQERDEVREPGVANQIRSEVPGDAENSDCAGCAVGVKKVERNQRVVRDAGAGNDERICGESRTDSSDTYLQRRDKPVAAEVAGVPQRFDCKANHCGEDGCFGPERRWSTFPAVSPVHRGNDGLPFPLDDLAIPATKWRTESLKAYGNAIVPQVMYRIFQAIEQCSEKI